MCGGNVQCFPAIVTGHKSRPGNIQPYKCYCYEIAHNEMVIAYLCLPEYFDKLMTMWQSLYSGMDRVFESAAALLNSHSEELMQLRAELSQKMKIRHKKLDEFNAAFQKKIGFSYTILKKNNEGTYPKFKSNEKINFPMG